MEQDKPQLDRPLFHRKKVLIGDHEQRRPSYDPQTDPKYLHLKDQMFSPQPRPATPLVSTSPPSKRLRGDPGGSPASAGSPGLNYFLPERHTPGQIGQNLSYARGFTGAHAVKPGADTSFPPVRNTVKDSAERLRRQGSESDEDERFLRLAREALVATANGVNPSGSTLVDPTIQDLLRRLQYAASPHGNPIKRSNNIRANENGQLMIQGFYQQFPNLSNDIFTGNADKAASQPEPAEGRSSNHPSSYNDGWNFLIGEPVTLKGVPYKDLEAAQERQKHHDEDDDDDAADEDEDEDDDADYNLDGSGTAASLRNRKASVANDDPSRKFLCPKCPMSFRRSSDLKRHEKQHLVIPPNICELCGKGFARKDALKRHMATLTCKRNADKKLYTENLKYLEERRSGASFDRH